MSKGFVSIDEVEREWIGKRVKIVVDGSLEIKGILKRVDRKKREIIISGREVEIDTVRTINSRPVGWGIE